ncbi:MAG TPA: hypothetical protein P5306_02430 [Kiritimatiellia bacterium]|nr:hypothetical protein [Kiritimatiellia bacterium]
METVSPDFPRYGKNACPASAGFSTLWKNPPVFSTPWKTFSNFFHAMEKVFPHRGKPLPLLFPVFLCFLFSC